MIKLEQVMYKKKLLRFLLLPLVAVSAPLHAELELGKLFSDHMVLQREAPNRVWGHAVPGNHLVVCIAEHCQSGTADETGAWEVTLPASPAGGPYELRVETGGESAVIRDVYLGDVWLAGGQSNMEWKLRMEIDELEAEYADSDYPLIRFFEVENRLSFEQQETLAKGNWLQASREAVENFSAVAWLFAKRNHHDKGVAVGIIDNNWGGTPAQAWVSRASLMDLPAYRAQTEALYGDLSGLDQMVADNTKATEEKYRRLSSREDAVATSAHRFDYDDANWKRLDFPSGEPFEDLAWFRRTFELEAVPAAGVVLDLGDLVQDAFVFVNEQVVAVEDWTDQGSRHELPAASLREGENLLVLRVGNSWNNRPRVGSLGNLALEIGAERIPLNDGWAYSNTVEPPLPVERRFQHEPATLYNGMIHPVRRYALRGVIWYQGESNVAEAPLYGDLFKTLITDWRRSSGQKLPFLFVQLAGFMPYQFPQADSPWAELRYQQEQALDLPRTGMATAIDIGDEHDIHPRNKQDVAKRLWLQARKVAFDDDVQADAPSVSGHSVNGGKVSLAFGSRAGRLEARGGSDRVDGFILSGRDGLFHPAEARLAGDTVTVWSEAVDLPVALRYAWSDFPRVNLYSENGLPVLPFRMDELDPAGSE